MIYKDIQMVWTTKLHTLPIFVARANFQQKAGLIVTLSDEGHLQISYLGTDQMTQTDLGKLHQNDADIDYQKMDEKHQSVMQKIRMQETEQTKMPTDSLSVNLQLSPTVEQSNEYIEDPKNLIARNGMGQLYRCKLKVTLSHQAAPGVASTGYFTNVQVDLSAPKGVYLEKKMFKHESLTLSGASTPPTEQMYVYAQRDLIPSDLRIEASLTYVQARASASADPAAKAHGLQRTSFNNRAKLPTSFFLRITQPYKDSMESKLHFQMTDGKILGGLPDFFSEMVEAQKCDESFKKDRNMSFEYHDGAIVSILVSKDNSKIRIQTNHLHCQWLLLREFVEKLEDMFPNRPIHDIIDFDQEMPLKDLFDDIDLHFQLRKEQNRLCKLLEQRTV